MRRAIITVGLSFGDEGKGATVDFLTRQLNADLVIRYCGGSQAGHNVQLPDGRRHTFSQFGAGSLVPSRPRTYLAQNVIIDPPALLREAEHLSELGVENPTELLYIHPRCLVSTPWHRTVNQLRELARGADRHGSCGQGIGETRSYWLKHGEDALFAGDLPDPQILRHKLELLRQRSLLEIQNIIETVPLADLQALDLFSLSTEALVESMSEVPRHGVRITETIPDSRMAILEGAQGVLLDEYRGFHPYTTWSTVTAHHAWEVIQQMDVDAVSVLGLTRAYTTRHGQGPLPSYSAELTERSGDPGNPWNRWQGNLRCGWLDLPLLRYALQVAGPFDGLVVNHLDHLPLGQTRLCEAYSNGPLTPALAPHLAWQERLTRQLQEATPLLAEVTGEELLSRLNALAPVLITGKGPTHEDRRLLDLRFRHRRRTA